MRKHQRDRRRSFTVEVKSSDRNCTAFIPSRIAPAVTQPPDTLPPLPLMATATRTEKRRILPNLIVPEPEAPEPQAPPLRWRGRPRKVPPVVVEPIAEPVVEAEPVLTALAPGLRPLPAKRIARPGAALTPGERWKRRLGRWSR